MQRMLTLLISKLQAVLANLCFLIRDIKVELLNSSIIHFSGLHCISMDVHPTVVDQALQQDRKKPPHLWTQILAGEERHDKYSLWCSSVVWETHVVKAIKNLRVNNLMTHSQYLFVWHRLHAQQYQRYYDYPHQNGSQWINCSWGLQPFRCRVPCTSPWTRVLHIDSQPSAALGLGLHRFSRK